MAVEIDNFSIREYTSRMRSVDVVKCWPFDETDEETVKSLLPPITVKKFTWWFDAFQSENNGGQDSSTYGTKDQAGKIMKSLKAKKQRAPKKRSIVEIFAVSPQVEKVSSEESDDEQVEGEEAEIQFRSSEFLAKENVNWGLKGKRKEKKKKERDLVLSKLKKKKKVGKGKKKENDKEALVMLTSRSQDSLMANQNHSSCDKSLEDDMDKAVHIYVKKHGSRHMPRGNDTQTPKPSTFMTESQKPVYPVRGILKSYTGITPMQKFRNGISQEVEENEECKEQADKHVTFSDKDDMLGERQKCLAMRKKGHEECIQNVIDNEVSVPAIPESQMSIASHTIDSTKFLRQQSSSQARSPGRPSTVYDSTPRGENLYQYEGGHRESSDDPLYACSPWLFCVSKEGYLFQQNTSLIRNASTAPSWGFIENACDPVLGLASLSSKDNLSRLENQKEKMPLFPSKSSVCNNNRHELLNQPFNILSRCELMHTMCHHPDENQRGLVYGKSRMDEGYFGLPLNSQGELIKSNLPGNGEFKLQTKPFITAAPSTMLGPFGNFQPNLLGNQSERRNLDGRRSSRDQLNLFPDKVHVNEKSDSFVTSRLGLPDCKGNGDSTLNLDLVTRSDNPFSSMEFYQNPLIQSHVRKKPDAEFWCPQSNKTEQGTAGCVSSHISQSTMRLMGKEFIVDGRGSQGDQLWRDKQMIIGHHSSSNATDNMRFQSNENNIIPLTLGKSRGSKRNHENMVLIKVPDSHSNRQTTDFHQTSCATTESNPAQMLYPYHPPGASSVLNNETSVFQELVTHGHESRMHCSEIPISVSTLQDPCRNVNSIDAQLKGKQMLSHVAKSSFKFPFLHPDLEGHAQKSWHHNLYQSAPEMLFGISDRGTSMSYCQPYSSFDSKHHPHLSPGVSRWTDSSVCHTSEALHLYPSFLSCPMQNSMTPPHVTCYPFEPCRPQINPNLVMRNRKVGMRLKEQSKPGVSTQGPYFHGHKSRKRLAVSDDCLKPRKISNLGSQEHCNYSVTKLTTPAGSQGDIGHFGNAFESSSANGEANIAEYGWHVADKDEMRVIPGRDSSNRVSRFPIKLTAGAKHILKPCQRVDPINPMSTRSIIPFSETTAAQRALENEKSTKMYRL